MNANDARNCDDDWIDLLVDGELDPDRRRELLLRLESAPDGWRRCALAFLESQAWREAFTPEPSPVRTATRTKPSAPVIHADPAQPMSHVAPETKNRASRKGFVHSASSFAAFAAGLLVAFILGRASGGTMNPPRTTAPDPGSVANSGATRKPRAIAQQDVVRPSSVAETTQSPRDLENDAIAPAASPAVLAQTGLGFDPNWVSSPPTPLPETVRQEVARQGYEVEKRRRLMAVMLRDGSRVSIPVEETQVRFVGNRTF